MLFLDLEVDMQNNILSIYTEFLRRIDNNIQFYIINRKLNIDQYIYNQFLDIDFHNEELENIYQLYIKDIQSRLELENIFTTKMYIICSKNAKEKHDIKEFEQSILLLERIGCKITKIIKSKSLKQILFETANKV